MGDGRTDKHGALRGMSSKKLRNIFDREYSNQLLLDSCQVGAGLLVHHKLPHLSLIINLVVGIHQINLECFVILFFVVLTSSLSCRKSRACQSSLYWS